LTTNYNYSQSSSGKSAALKTLKFYKSQGADLILKRIDEQGSLSRPI